MYTTHDENGNITSILFGNVNLNTEIDSYITVPSNIELSEETRVNTSSLELENITLLSGYVYEINEATENEAFDLETI
jgi:hypothetical protein